MRPLVLFFPALLSAQVAAPKVAPPKPAATKSASTKTAVAKKASAPAAQPRPAAAPTLATDDEKAIYSLGLSLQRSLAQFDLSAAEMEIIKRALADGAAGKPAIDFNEWRPKIEALGRARSGRVAEREKAASLAYLNQAAAEPGATRTESGLIYRELRSGSGASPKATDTVKVHYRGTLINGTEFDSSYRRKEPTQFALNAVIRCWTEGVQKMKVGGKASLVCPSDLAYGDRGRPSIPAGAALLFEIELLEIAGAEPRP